MKNKKNINELAKELLIEVTANANTELVPDLLNDLFSSKEVKNLSRRVLIAGLRYRGFSFGEIGDLLHCSSITVNKVHFKTKGSPALRQLIDESKLFNRLLPVAKPASRTPEKYPRDRFERKFRMYLGLKP